MMPGQVRSHTDQSVNGFLDGLTIHVAAADHDVSIPSHQGCVNFSENEWHTAGCKNGDAVSDLCGVGSKTDIAFLGDDEALMFELGVDRLPYRFVQVVALVVTTQGADGEILIGGGRYATEGAGSGQAEIAFIECFRQLVLVL